MPTILLVDLSEQTIRHIPSDSHHYGRGLAVSLLKQYAPAHCPRLSPQNALVIVPGLLTGSPVPCATRATVAARDDDGSTLAVSSITGDLPQKLASLNIAAVVILGKAAAGNAVIYIDDDAATLRSIPELQGLHCGEIVSHLRAGMGEDCAIAGCGPAADLLLPLSGMFTTYPEGTPRFTCPRSSFGDIPGSKGLRAIVVKHKQYFEAPCADSPALLATGKLLAGTIVSDPICGGALPGLGSITILHLLKNRQEIPKLLSKATPSHPPAGKRINYCCAPMCVIGCLNRHSGSSGHLYAAPEEAEVHAALEKFFGTAFSEEGLNQIAAALSARGMELGFNTTEFVCGAAMYLRLQNMTPTAEGLLALLEEVAAGTMIGRLLGNGTAGIGKLYLDDAAAQSAMTRPATQKAQEYQLQLARLYPELEELDDLEILYRQIFLMENLGLCIFSSFALLNKEEPLALLAQLYTHKTGVPASPAALLTYAGECLAEEEALRQESTQIGTRRNIPEFVKVLYRYFSEEE